ncbi:unnamed protein product [Aphanomyces euteiches]
MSSGLPPANAWDANNLAARYDRYRIDLAKISEAPSEEFDLRIAGDAYGTPECFRPLPPSGPGYPLHVDFVALGRKLKALRGLLLEGDFDLAYAASSCLDIILAMRPFAMDDARWRRYIEEHHDMDLGVTRGSRNRHGEVRTPKGIVPVAPLLGETALEYAAVWFLKLVNYSNQVQNKLRDYTYVLEDLANYAKSRHRGPRLHFYVVRWLLAVRSHRYIGLSIWPRDLRPVASSTCWFARALALSFSVLSSSVVLARKSSLSFTYSGAPPRSCRFA